MEDVCKVEKEPLVENELKDFSEIKVNWNETIVMNFKTCIETGNYPVDLPKDKRRNLSLGNELMTFSYKTGSCITRTKRMDHLDSPL